jgi:hypothetical protein
VKNERCPSTGRISGAIAALSSPERIRLTIPNTNKRPNYRAIRIEHLKAWAVRNGFATPEDIDTALEKDTEQVVPHLRSVK